MYLKLGTTNIKYNSEVNDFMIISEVINSKTSLPRPCLVRTSDELDIWFGREFDQRKYFDELIKSRVTLLLYKPVSTEKDSNSSGYIDYSDFQESQEIYIKSEDIESPKEDIIYRVYNPEGEYFGEDDITGIPMKYSKYLFIESLFVNLIDLPQNIDPVNSMSFNNKETLRINSLDYNGPRYVNPRYFGEREENYEEYQVDSETLLSNLPDLEKLSPGYETLAIDIIIDEDSFKGIKDGSGKSRYIVIKGLTETVLIWFKYKESTIPDISPNLYDRSEYIEVDSLGEDEILEKLIEKFIGLGYILRKQTKNLISLYTSFKIEGVFFYTIPGFDIEPNYRVTQDILSGLSLGNYAIDFYSNTIGRSESSGKIQTRIEEVDDGKYRVTISRFDYSEIFEGTLGLEDNLENNINRESKLVTCRINALEDKLPTGTWELRGAIDEIYTKDMYWKSLASILEGEILVDYFFIPDISKYVDSISPDYSYFTEYERIVELCKKNGCQVLIQNSDSPWKILEVESLPKNPEQWKVYKLDGRYYILGKDGELVETSDRLIINEVGNDCAFNYTGDKENRIIYFYRPLRYLGNNRPGYYLYIKNLLSDIYMASEKDVLYEYPSNNPYITEDIERLLISYKTNYLVTNNHLVYYKNYQSGEKPITTGWMRFCLGKVSRELEKNKWNFISQRTVGKIESNIQGILDNIRLRFSIIREIKITNLNIDYRNNLISLSISTKMSDLVNNDMEIDLTLNYNN